MGLFSSKTEIKVANSVSRVVEDRVIPETQKESVLRGIIQSEGIAGHLLEGQLNGPGFKFERKFRYAKEHYVHRLPRGRVFSRNAGDALVATRMREVAGKAVDIQYSELGAPNSFHFARMKLIKDYGHNPETNEIESLSRKYGTAVYMESLQVIYPEQMLKYADKETLEGLGPSVLAGYTPLRPLFSSRYDFGRLVSTGEGYLVDPEIDEERVLVRCLYQSEDGEADGYARESFVFGLDADNAVDYFQAYGTYSQDGERKHLYWAYPQGSGTYPELDNLFVVGDEVQGTYMPIIFFRREGQDVSRPNNRKSKEFAQLERMMRMIEMDYLGLADGMNGNPGVGDVEQAVLLYGIALNDESDAAAEYLYEFFNAHRDTDTAGGFDGTGIFRRRASQSRALVVEEKDFRIYLSYRNITKRRRSGRIGKPGSFASAKKEESRYGGYVFRKQVSGIFYDEIEVVGARLSYDIYKGREVVVQSSDDDHERLLIPLDKSILDLSPMHRREQIYLRGMHFVFNSKQEIEIKWYQQGWFSSFLLVAAIALTVVSLGKAWPTIAAAAAVGTLTLVLTLVTMIVKALVIDYAFKLVVSEIGGEAALVLATVLAIWGGVKAFQSGSLDAPWAKELMQASTGLTKGVNAHTADLHSKYKADVAEFELYKSEAEAEIEEQLELLDSSSLIDPFEFIGERPLHVWGEEPDRFYLRTIHSGNIGVLAFDAIHHYVDINLRLPEPHETLGGFSL